MRFLLIILSIVMATVAAAQICPSTPADYQLQYRPDGEPANYPPEGEPDCYIQSTQAEAMPMCNTCHMPWRTA